MSVIVAIKENGVVYLGADTQTTIGTKRRKTSLHETNFKINKLENGILLGFCGLVAKKQEILSIKKIFTLDENGCMNKEHIVKNIIPKLVRGLNKEDGEWCLGVTILLAYKDSMYYINSLLEVVKLNDYAKIGSGSSYVDYAILSTKGKGIPVKERLLKALTESAKRCDAVCGPYVLIDTKDLQYEIIDMGGENY